MSQSVMIRTHTVTTGSGSAIIVNTGYFKTFSGILKVLQLALGIVCVGIMGHQFNVYGHYRETADLFFLLISTSCMLGTCMLLLSCLISISTASIIAKTVYELLYHAISFGLLLAASLTFMVHTTVQRRRSTNDDFLLAAAICGLINAGLYFFSTIIALRSYRGI